MMKKARKQQKNHRLPLLILPILILLRLTISLGKTPLLFAAYLSGIFRKKRGRPRLTPFFPFYLQKTKKFFSQLIPKPVRIGLAVAAVSAVIFGYSFSLIAVAKSLPSPDGLGSTPQPLTTSFYDRSGRLLYRLYEGQHRKLVKLDSVPLHLRQATIAIEDKNFYSHPGIDLFGVVRALRTNFDNGNGKMQGGSTITQQLIKNTLLTPDKTYTRKIKEAILAFWVERIYHKDQILEMYFNQVAYGGPAWGVAAAAEMYFGKQVGDLTLAESAYLAGLPVAPTEYSPYGPSPHKGQQRQKEVLKRMIQEGYISQSQAQQAEGETLTFKPPTWDIKAPHFVFYVRSQLAAKYGEKVVSQGGLKVTTTLDLDIQEMAEEAVKRRLDEIAKLNVTNGASLVTDAKTGQILAMVGSRDYYDQQGGNYNVTTALRPPGSSIKPVTYAAAFKKGFSPGSVILDVPTSFTDPATGTVYSPVNYDGKFHGPTSIRMALASSYNVPAVKALALVGLPAFLETARDLGITTFTHPEYYGLSLTLGGADVRMVDMMAVYGTFAQGGVRHNPTAVLTVTDSRGQMLEDNRQSAGKRVLTSEVAYLITSILSDNKARVPAFGERSLLEIPGHSVAVKTGTSDAKKDNLAFGYTPDFVVGAWVGNSNNAPMHPSLSSGVTGATPIWHDIMKNLLEGKPGVAFDRPAGIVEAAVDGNRDLSIAGEEKEVITYTDPFNSFITP